MPDDIPDIQDPQDAWPAWSWPARGRVPRPVPSYTPDDPAFYRRALGLALLFEHRNIPLRPAQEDVLVALIELQEADAGPGSLLPNVVQELLQIASWPCWDPDLAALADELDDDAPG